MVKPNKYIHKKTRQLIADAMLHDALGGWYETNQNPRKPDSQIAVEVLDQYNTVVRAIAERKGKKEVEAEVCKLAAQTVAWLQGLTYQKDVKAWT